MPGHQDRPQDGDPDRRRVLRGRQERAARRARRRGCLHRPPALEGIVPGDGQDHRRLQADRGRGRPSGLRLPLRERGVLPAARGRGHRLHRPQALFDRRDGRQDRLQEARPRRAGEHDPGLQRAHRLARAGRGDRPRDRLSGDDQGLGGRRRPGPAGRLRRQGGRRGLLVLPDRGQERLRRRPGLPREVHRGAPAHRDPGTGRRPRQRRLPLGARVLDAAPAPEGHRGGPLPVPRRGHPPGHGRAGRGAGEGRAVPVRRHGRVRRRQGQGLLLPGDEHAAPGRAPGHRADHRAGPRRADDPRGRRREAPVHPGPGPPRRLGDRVPDQRRGPVPQLPPLHRAARPVPAPRRKSPARCGSTRASSRATRSRCTTIR